MKYIDLHCDALAKEGVACVTAENLQKGRCAPFGLRAGFIATMRGFLQHDDLYRPESEPFKKFAAGIILPLAFFLKACYNVKGFIGGLWIWKDPSIGRGANHSDGVSLKVASRFSPKANVAEGKDREIR